jgi:hypothetical protein
VEFHCAPDDPSIPDPGREPGLLASETARAEDACLRQNVRHYVHLPPDKQAAMRDIARVLAAKRRWEGGAGFQVTEEMKLTIAGQASLLVLGLDQPYYFDRVPSIIVYERPYRHLASVRSGYLILREDMPLYGEAWYRGPVVLSWDQVLASGRNASGGHDLVLHEFAHHVDALDGEMDGTPPLAGREQRRTWYRVTEGEYRRLVGSTRRGEATLLDQYGATNRAEFFAVTTECFFEQPHAFRREHKDLYAVLRDFYRQDPAEWLPDATVRSPSDSLGTSSGRSSGKPHKAETRQNLQRRIRRSQNGDGLFTLAVECLKEREHDLAEEALSKAIRLNPADAEAHQERAVARVKLGKYQQALADCDEAIRLDPDDTTAYCARGAAHVGLRQYEKGIEDLDRFLAENGTTAEARYLRGLAESRLGDLKQAISDLSAAIVCDSFLAEAYFERAQAQRGLGRFDEADADLEAAFQLDPYVDRPM